MKRWGEFLSFAAVAVALHLGLVALVLPDLDGAEAGGVGGEAVVTLQGAPDQVAEMIKEWTRPPVHQTDAPQREDAPEVVEDAPQMAALTLDAAPDTSTQIAALSGDVPDPALPVIPSQAAPPPPPEMSQPVLQQPVLPNTQDPRPKTTAEAAPRPMARPTAPRPVATEQPKSPQADVQPPEAPKPEPKPEPEPVKKPEPKPEVKSKPKAKPKPKSKAKASDQNRAASAGSATQKAAGTGGTNQAGNAGKSKVKALGKGKEAKLKSIWGSKIVTRIERRKKALRGVKAKGKTTLALRIAPSGQLLSVSVAKSSGVAALDEAAIAAVKRAGKFPKAPKGLTDKSYRFNIPIRMN